MKSEEVLKGLNDLKQYIQEEVNVADVLFTNDPSKYQDLSIVFDSKELGKRLKKDFNQDLKNKLNNLS
jgi:hypothetical protein